MYAAPPVRRVDARPLPMATVCLPESSDESWTTFPVFEPEKNWTVMRAEPAPVAAATEFSTACFRDPELPAATEADAGDVTARPSRQATTVRPARPVFGMRPAARSCMTHARYPTSRTPDPRARPSATGG